MNDSLSGKHITLARLLGAVSMSDWIQLNKMYTLIDEALQQRRQITKKKNLSRRLNILSSTFTKFEKRILLGLQELNDIIPQVTHLIDSDCLPTQEAILISKLAAWVNHTVTEACFELGAGELAKEG